MEGGQDGEGIEERLEQRQKQEKCLVTGEKCIYFPKEGGRAERGTARDSINEPHGCPPAWPRYKAQVPASPAHHCRLLPRGSSATGMRTSIWRHHADRGVVRSGLKNLGDSKAALQHLRSKAETDRSKRWCGWEVPTGGGFSLALHPALTLRLSHTLQVLHTHWG